jgi:hypothetical protein
MSEQDPASTLYPAESEDPLAVLSAPLDDGSAFTAVMSRRPRVRLPSLTMALGVVVVASAGFLAGALVNKHLGTSSTSGGGGAFRQFAAARATGGTSGGTGAGTRTGTGLFAGAAGGTLGVIKLIDGSTVYVQTTAGDIVQVKTSTATKVTVSETVPVKNLTPGETVIVQGSKNSSGAIAATSINQTSLGG